MMPKVKYIDKACAGLQEIVGDLDNYSLDNTPPPPPTFSINFLDLCIYYRSRNYQVKLSPPYPVDFRMAQNKANNLLDLRSTCISLEAWLNH